jgi:hypothetical protein
MGTYRRENHLPELRCGRGLRAADVLRAVQRHDRESGATRLRLLCVPLASAPRAAVVDHTAPVTSRQHPLTRYSIRGAFWFQGEHNVVTHSSTSEYACVFGAMINEWRDAWTGIGDFPFMWAQLAPYTGYAPFAGKGDISTVRLAQVRTDERRRVNAVR